MSQKELLNLVSVGKQTLCDFQRLGIRSTLELAKADPVALYERLAILDGQKHDPCVLDTLFAAVAQSRHADLKGSAKKWWYWSRIRKEKGIDGLRKELRTLTE